MKNNKLSKCKNVCVCMCIMLINHNAKMKFKMSIGSFSASIASKINKLLHSILILMSLSLYKYSRLSLSRSRRDPLKHFEISVIRHTKYAELRKIPNEQPNFTNNHVI